MPLDLTPYMKQTNAVNADWSAKSNANTFAKTLSQMRGSRDQVDFKTGFKRQLPKFTASFGQRGLQGGGVTSGIQNHAMANFTGDYTQNLGRMQEDQLNTNQQFDFNQTQFDANKATELADIQANKAAEIARTADAILGLKSIGGL